MSISSLSTLQNLSLWLDSTDLSTFTFNSMGSNLYDVLQWRDKSSNGYVFSPLMSNYRPVLSTNAVVFNYASSFQLMSQQKIPAGSTVDLFFVMNPTSLKGPRQAFFDSADFTACETDNRLNVQVYADGGEFFRPDPTINYTGAFQVYQGDLFAATNVNQRPNYLQRYNRENLSFEYFPFPMSSIFTRGMSVYDGKLFTVSDNRVEYFNGSTGFISTTLLSSSATAPITYMGNFFASANGSLDSRSNALQRPQLYKWDPATDTMFKVTDLNGSIVLNNPAIQTNSNAIWYKGNMLIAYTNSFGGVTNTIGYYNNSYFNSNGLINSFPNGYLSVYNGNLLVPRADTRLFKWNDYLFQNIGRQLITNPVPAGVVTYKGLPYYILNNAIGSSNIVEVYSGERGGPSQNALVAQVTTNSVTVSLTNGMIVHDGKLFFTANANGFAYELGNGITLDRSVASTIASPMIVLLRKSQTGAELHVNGLALDIEQFSFTYENQPARQMYIGGAAGLMASGTTDCGLDHLTGAIHEVAQFSSNLNLLDQQKVEGILAWRYGIQTVLPVGHPYRNNSP